MIKTQTYSGKRPGAGREITTARHGESCLKDSVFCAMFEDEEHSMVPEYIEFVWFSYLNKQNLAYLHFKFSLSSWIKVNSLKKELITEFVF